MDRRGLFFRRKGKEQNVRGERKSERCHWGPITEGTTRLSRGQLLSELRM